MQAMLAKAKMNSMQQMPEMIADQQMEMVPNFQFMSPYMMPDLSSMPVMAV